MYVIKQYLDGNYRCLLLKVTSPDGRVVRSMFGDRVIQRLTSNNLLLGRKEERSPQSTMAAYRRYAEDSSGRAVGHAT